MTFQRSWRVCLNPPLLLCQDVDPKLNLGRDCVLPTSNPRASSDFGNEGPQEVGGEEKNLLTNKLLFCKTPCHSLAKGKAHGFTSQMQEPLFWCEVGQSQEASVSLNSFLLRKSGWMFCPRQCLHQYLFAPGWMSVLPACLSQDSHWGIRDHKYSEAPYG